MDVPLPDDDIRVFNPITEDHTRLRTSLLPGLLAILRANRHRDLPQAILEPGSVGEHVKNVWKGAGLKVHAKAGFTEMKSIIVSALPVFRREFSLSDYEHPSFVHGRCASIIIEGDRVGYFGELHPKVISAFDLEFPVVGFELDLEALKK